MPKLVKTPEEAMNLELLGAMSKQMIRLEYMDKHLYGWLKCAPNTLLRRKKQPETMTLGELRIICDKLHLTDREVCAALGVTYRGITQ